MDNSNKKEYIWESLLSFGALLIAVFSFADSQLWERIVFLVGIAISITGSIGEIIKYRKKGRRGMVIFFSIICGCLIVAFVGLLLRLCNVF